MPLSSQQYLEELRRQRPAFLEESIATQKGEVPEHGAWDVVSQFANGFITGFTTLDVGEAPVTGAERLSQSLGHLLGFVGYIPGPGLLGKLSATGLARGSGIIARSIRGAQMLKSNMVPSSMFGVPVRSVPMLGADLIMQGLKSSVGKLAIMDSLKLAGGRKVFGRTMTDMMEGGLHLGFASAISARPFYQLDLDDRWQAFWSGAPAGAAFRLMGNAINKGGLVDMTKLLSLGETAGRRANALARAFSGAAMMGLPATYHDEPLELQVYEYLLGAYFGGMEMSSAQRRVLRDLQKYRTGKHPHSDMMEPEKLEEWKFWNRTEREEALYQRDMEVGRLIQAGVDGFQYARPAFLARARAEFNSVSHLLKEAGGDYGVVAELMGVHPRVVRRIVLGERLNEKIETKAEQLQETKETRSENASEPLPSGESGEIPPVKVKTKESLTEAERATVLHEALREVAQETRVEETKAAETRESVSMFMRTLSKVLEDPQVYEKSEIEQALQNSDVNSALMKPLSRLAERLSEGYKSAEGAKLKTQMEVRREIYEIAKEELTRKAAEEGEDGFANFRRRLEEKYKFTLHSDEARSLREMWNFVKVARPISLMEWVVGEGLRELKQINALGANVERHAAPSPLDEILGGTRRLESVRTSLTNKNGENINWITTLYREDGELPWTDVLLQSVLSDTPFIGEYKDSPSILFGRWVNELANPSGRAAAAEVVLGRLRDLRVEGRSGEDAYREGLAQFMARVPRSENGQMMFGKTAIGGEQVKQMFDALWAQNLLLLEKINGGIRFEEILTNEGGKFVNTWVDFNKRMQVLATGAIPVEEKALDLWDVRKHGGLRAVIIRSTGYGDDARVWERERYADGKPTGFAVQASSETSRDGGVFLRRDVFDRLMMWAGGDALAGFEKSHAFHVDPTLGAFLSKRGVHKADAEMDKWLMENELHAVEFTTTAKQRGRRKVSGLTYDATTGKHALEDAVDNVAFIIPVSAMRHNPTTREIVASQLKDQHAVVQMFYNITLVQGGEQAIKDIARDVLLPSWRGREDVNARVGELLKTEDQEAVRASLAERKLEIDDIDGATLLKVLRGSDARPTALWKHLFEQLLGRFEETRTAADAEGVHSEAYKEFSRSFAEIRSAADKLFSVWESSPVTALNPLTERMFDSVLWSYLRERVTSPKVANSMKSYIVPHSPFVRAKYGRGSQGRNVQSLVQMWQQNDERMLQAWDSNKEPIPPSVRRPDDNGIVHAFADVWSKRALWFPDEGEIDFVGRTHLEAIGNIKQESVAERYATSLRVSLVPAEDGIVFQDPVKGKHDREQTDFAIRDTLSDLVKNHGLSVATKVTVAAQQSEYRGKVQTVRDILKLPQNEGQLKDGTYMLARGARSKPVTVNGVETTLGEVWDAYVSLQAKMERGERTFFHGTEVKGLESFSDPDRVVYLDDYAGASAYAFPATGSHVGEVLRVETTRKPKLWTLPEEGPGYWPASADKVTIERLRREGYDGYIDDWGHVAIIRPEILKVVDRHIPERGFKGVPDKLVADILPTDVERNAKEFFEAGDYVIRVPADSASGLRVSKFKGFVNEVDGTGIFLSDLDMRAVGGADTDGDSVFIYNSLSLPRSMRDFYSRPEVQSEWYEQLPVREGGGRVPVMKDATETNELQQGISALSRASRDPLSFGNPLVGLETHRNAVLGNQQLGPGLNLMRSVLASIDAQYLDAKTLGHTDRMQMLEGMAQKARDFKRAIVNGAADASGGAWLKDILEVRELVKETFGLDPVEADRLAKMTALLKGYDTDWQRPYTIDETAYLLNLDAPAGQKGTLPLTRRDAITPRGKERLAYPNLWFYAADVLAEGLRGVETNPWLILDRGAVESKQTFLREMMAQRKTARDAGIAGLLKSIGRYYLATAPNMESFADDVTVSGQAPFTTSVDAGAKSRYSWTIPERIAFDKMPKYLRDQFVRHMIFQDAMDVATAKTLHGIWQKWVEGLDPKSDAYREAVEKAKRIRNEVEQVKFLERARQRRARADSVESGLKPAASVFDSYLVRTQLEGEAGAQGAWWKPGAKWIGYKNLSPVEQMYYSAFAAGSLFQQRSSFPQFMRKWRASLELPKGMNPQSKEADALRQAHDRRGADAWHERSWNSAGLKLPFIAREAVGLLGQSMHEFFYKPMTKEDFRAWLLEEKKTPLVDKLIGEDARELRHNEEIPALREKVVEALRVERALFDEAGKPKEPPKAEPEQVFWETVETTTPGIKETKPKKEEPPLPIEQLARVKARDPKVEAEIQSMADELAEVMKRYPWLIKYFDGIFAEVTAGQSAYGVGTDIQKATMPQLRRFLYEMGRKRFTDKDKGAGRPVPWYAYFLWPEKIDSYLVAWDARVVPNERRMVFAEGGMREQTTYSLISHQGYNSQLAGKVIAAKDDEVASLRQELYNRLSELYHLPGDVANDFFRYAQAVRERGRDTKEGVKDGRYAAEYKKALEEMREKYGEYPLTRMEKGVSIPVKAEEVLGRAVQMQNEWAERMGKLVRDDALEANLLAGALEKDGFLNIRALIGKLTKDAEFPAFTWNLLKRMREWQIVLQLPVKVREDALAVAKIRPHTWEEARRSVGDDQVAYREVRLGDIEDLAYRRMMYRRAKADPDVNVANWMEFRNTELMDFGEYFPHLGWPEKVWREHYEKGREKVMSRVEPYRLAAQMEREIERLQTLTADGGLGNYLSEALLSTGMSQRDIIEAGLSRIPRNLAHRTDEGGSVPGYDKTPRAFGEYQKRISEGRWNLLYSIISHETIRSFERERPLGEHTEAWATFMRQEVQSVLGFPSVYPREWVDNPSYKIKNSPYWFFTDQYWLNLAKSLGIRFGKGETSLINRERVIQDATRDAERILGKTIRKKTVTPEEADVVDAAQKARLLELSRKLADARVLAKFSWLSNLEAKFQLMSLLTHTKTATANVFGGSLNSVVSAGFEPWRKAGNYQYLKDRVFQSMDDIRSMKDIESFAEKHGGIESFVTELAARGVAPSAQLRAFFADVQAKAAGGDPLLAKTTLAELTKKHGLSERFMDWASVFMRVSERAVRRRSWMAHYLRARDVLDVNRVQVEADHPWLIEMARRGTEASQFLYNNAARPMFSRTSVGKVFARFQLWAWNSVKFRNEIYARARVGGFTPGTPEFDRFQRMVVADLFVMGLAGLFPTSLFGASLPAPYSYLQDLSAYFFGDDRERDRAFYGTLPYPLNITKLGMPPAARLLDPAFVAITGGDWDKFATYTVWTYFPFGRLARGLSRTIENPTMIAENFFGIPLHELSNRIKKDEQMPGFVGFWGGRTDDQEGGRHLMPPTETGALKRDYERLEAMFNSVDSRIQELSREELLSEDTPE